MRILCSHRSSLTFAGSVLFGSLLWTGCSSSANLLDSQPSASSGQIISGVTARGLMTSGAVQVVSVGTDGSDGSILETSTVHSDGTYATPLTTPTSGPLRVKVMGGTYPSELDGSNQATAFTLTALVDSGGTLPTLLPVTPLTAFVDSFTSGQVKGGASLAEAHQQANELVMSAYGFPSGTTAEQVVPDFSGNASGVGLQATAVLGGLEAEAKSLGLVDRGSLVDALKQDISDGVFDGKASGVPIPFNHGVLPVDAGTTRFLTGVQTFVTAQQAQTPALPVAASKISSALPGSPVAVTTTGGTTTGGTTTGGTTTGGTTTGGTTTGGTTTGGTTTGGTTTGGTTTGGTTTGGTTTGGTTTGGTTGTGGNLLVNGGFELPVVGSGTFVLANTGDNTTIPGWTVVGANGNVGVVSGTFSVNGLSFPSQTGQQWLDLTGESNTPTGVQQTVTTLPGTTYSLSFFVGNVVDPGGAFGTNSTIDVVVNGNQILAAVCSAGNGTMTLTWQQFNASFVANSTSTSISFINADPITDSSNGLDGVVLTAGP